MRLSVDTGGRTAVSYPSVAAVASGMEEGKEHMRGKQVLENADAVAIMAAAKAESLKNGWGVSIVVVDDGGLLLAAERLDGAAPITMRNACEKARTAALFRRPSKLFEDMAKEHPAFLSLELQIIAGGVPIFAQGECVGAVGVSGVTREGDVQVAEAGAAAIAG
ncbi:MAG TPA: heme-binding protein [Novosphingobium sp.]